MVRTQIVERDEQEDHRRKAARPEPADQRNGVPPQRRPDERERHRRHPHDRQAQGGVGDEERVEAHRHDGPDQARRRRAARRGTTRPGRSTSANSTDGSERAGRRPEGDPGPEGRHEPVPADGRRTRIGEDREGDDGERLGRRRGPTPRRVRPRGAGRRHPRRRSRRRRRWRSRARPRRASAGSPCVSSAAAIARDRVTNGVAIPSFSPLSMLIARRTRTGIARSRRSGRLSAASVGARIDPTSRAKPTPRAGNRSQPTRAPAAMVSGNPMREEPARQPGDPTGLPESDRRGVGEQKEGEGQLGQHPERFGRRRGVDRADARRPEQCSGRHEQDRTADRQAVETNRDQRVARGSRARRGRARAPVPPERAVYLPVK